MTSFCSNLPNINSFILWIEFCKFNPKIKNNIWVAGMAYNFFLFCTYFPKQICCTIQSIIRAGLKLTVKSCTQLLIVYSYYHTFFPSLLNRFAGWIASKFCDAIPVIYFYKYNIYEMLVKVGLSAELALRQPRITRPPKSVLNSVVRQCRVTSSSFFCKHLECSKNFEVSFRFQMAI